jgi:hypothetical protein
MQLLLSLIAALIGGGFALAGHFLTNWFNRRDAKRREETVNRRYLRALSDELQATWDVYKTDIGDHIDELEIKGGALEYNYPVSSQLLPVYHANLGTLLNLEDHELRKQIVVTCTGYVGLMDCFNTNNTRLQSYEEAEGRAAIGPDPNKRLAAEATRFKQTLADYVGNAISYHKSWKDDYAKLQEAIRLSLG